MATIFQLNTNGTVNVLNKLFVRNINEEEFQVKSVNMKFEEFLNKYIDKKFRSALEVDMRRLKRINKLSKIGPKLDIDDKGKFVLAGFYIGNTYFEDFFKTSKTKKSAIEYAVKIYGKDAIEALLKEGIFNMPNKEEIENASSSNEFIKYYFNRFEINKDGYNVLYNTINNLTRVRDTRKPLEHSTNDSNKRI